jgi:hypothetical protein
VTVPPFLWLNSVETGARLLRIAVVEVGKDFFSVCNVFDRFFS